MPRRRVDPLAAKQRDLEWAEEDLNRAIERANALRREGRLQEAQKYDVEAAQARHRIAMNAVAV